MSVSIFYIHILLLLPNFRHLSLSHLNCGTLSPQNFRHGRTLFYKCIVCKSNGKRAINKRVIKQLTNEQFCYLESIIIKDKKSMPEVAVALVQQAFKQNRNLLMPNYVDLETEKIFVKTIIWIVYFIKVIVGLLIKKQKCGCSKEETKIIGQFSTKQCQQK